MNKKQLAEVLGLSEKILEEFDLCDHCLGRIFAKRLRLRSGQRLGKKIHSTLKIKNTKCYICKNIFEALPLYTQKMLDASECYRFRTFLVGSKLRPSVLDRDDNVRSKFRLRGMDSIKAAVTKRLVTQFAKKTKKSLRSNEPDVTFTIDFKTESCQVQSKPLYLLGKYTKQERGIPQKQRPCENCSGKGCVTCSQHGMTEFDSVEGMISKFLFERFGASQTRITWIGGEDSSSLVLGSGRPFFVKLLNPKKRNVRLPKKIRAGRIDIHNMGPAGRPPANPVQFESKVVLLISSEMPIPKNAPSRLCALEEGKIAIYENSGKRAVKSVRNISCRVQSENTLLLSMTAEGGLPMKHLVSGENVFPNVSDLLEVPCRCETFDFKEIKILN